MKELKISQDIYGHLLCLLNSYVDSNMPPADYLQLTDVKFPFQGEECDSVKGLFFLVIQNKKFLTDFVNKFYCLGNRRDHTDENTLIILCYILLSILNSSNKETIIQILEGENLTKMRNLLEMFTKKSIAKYVFTAGCKYFDKDYIFENIISRLKDNNGVLEEMLYHIKNLIHKKNLESQKTATRPVSPNLTEIKKQPLIHPANTPQEMKPPPAKEVPSSMYNVPKVQEALDFLKELNHRESSELMDAAEKVIGRLSIPRLKHSCPIPFPHENPLNQRKLVVNNSVYVKKNAASILREAYRVIKEEEMEIQKMTSLLSGASNYSKYEEWLENVRATDEQNKLEDIERKHLQGLLSREEAILARQAQIRANKEKRAQYDQQKREIEDILKNMKEKNGEKLKELKEKTQQIQKNIFAKKRNLISEKHKSAQEVADTSRQLYEEAILKKKKEMQKRIEIIREIKVLSSIKDLQSNKFDPTETTNLGLLCEMSLAELQERLQLNKASLKEEIENRQKCTREQRHKQQEYLSDTELFIKACRNQKKTTNSSSKEKPRFNKNLQEKQDIIELRQKLQSARNKRMELKN